MKSTILKYYPKTGSHTFTVYIITAKFLKNNRNSTNDQIPTFSLKHSGAF